MSHIGALLGGSFAGGFILSLAIKYVPSLIKKEVQQELTDFLNAPKAEKDKKILKAFVVWIDESFPGNDCCGRAVDWLSSRVPPLGAYKEQLIELFSTIYCMVKQDFDEAAK